MDFKSLAARLRLPVPLSWVDASGPGAGENDKPHDLEESHYLDESIAYSAYLASHGTGAGTLGFAEFIRQWESADRMDAARGGARH